VTAVRKAVIPAAGLGTRFLPVTKSLPKEMLPIVDKPSIEYVVEEAVAAGLTDVLIITGRAKRATEDHFDRNFELEYHLERQGRTELLKAVQASSELADIHYVRQRDPLGLGHAVSVAREHVGDEPFAVLLPDDILVDDAALLRSMIATYQDHDRCVLALLEVGADEISSYGCAAPRARDAAGVIEVAGIVEKPPADEAPSNLAVFGRYVFSPRIFDALDRITPGRGGELQLTDAIALLLESETVYGRTVATRHDIGQKVGWLRANIELALERPDLGGEVREMLAEIVATHRIDAARPTAE
jgi:UTP--glucose-1-phosphate uridylyltransferase